MAKDKNDRFDVVETENSFFGGNAKIIVDRQTGVNYMFYQSGYAGGLTPLLDRDGNVIVSAVYSDGECRE